MCVCVCVRLAEGSSINNRPTGLVLATHASCGGWWSGNFEKRRAPLRAPHSRSDVWWMNLPSPPHSMHPLDVHRVGRACVRACVRVCARVYVTVRGHGNWNTVVDRQFLSLYEGLGHLVDYFERERNKNPTCS